MEKGKFVVFDGSDGSGKQTQVAMLADHCRSKNLPVKTIDFPRYENNFHGKILKAVLRGEFGDFVSLDPYVASFLYIADRFESAKEMRKWLNDGNIVIADRFTTANMIHQGGKFESTTNSLRRNFYLNWLNGLEFGYLHFPEPSAVVFLKVPVAVSLALLTDKKGRDLAEQNVSHLTQSLACAEDIAKYYDWIMIDCAPNGAMRTRESIHEEVVAKLGPVLSL